MRSLSSTVNTDNHVPVITSEPFVVASDGTMTVPTGPGIGVEPDPERLAATTVRVERIRAP